MGPGTAIRESGIEYSHSESEQPEQKNLNDVCFGCDGSCSDITCSSKRSSRISADVESNICDSECTSPTHQSLRRILDDRNMNPEELEEAEIDSNQNLEQKSTSTPEKSGTGNGNNTDEEVLADDVIPVDSEIPEICVDAVTINNYSNLKNSSLKRSISDNPMNQSPSKIPHMRMDSTDSEGQYMICRSIGIQARARRDSWSEDEGAVGDSEEDFTRRHVVHFQRAQSNQSTYSCLSSEGISEEEGAHHPRRRKGLMSTTSTDNLQLELTNNMNDGLSDKEMVVKRMKNQVASPEHILNKNHLADTDTDSSDSDECSVASTVHRKRNGNTDNQTWSSPRL